MNALDRARLEEIHAWAKARLERFDRMKEVRETLSVHLRASLDETQREIRTTFDGGAPKMEGSLAEMERMIERPIAELLAQSPLARQLDAARRRTVLLRTWIEELEAA